jgi:type II secretory pathway component PulF
VLAVGIRVLGGRSGWSRVMSAMPIFGDLWHWSSVSEMLRGLRLLLESQIPLPDALRLTADSLRDRYMAVGCARLAQLVSEGQSLSNALESTPVPRSILPLLRSGERQGTLIESIELATELLEVRLKSMSQLVASLAPPLIFLWVVVLIGGTYVSLMMPTVSLIQGLSQGTTLFTGLM